MKRTITSTPRKSIATVGAAIALSTVFSIKIQPVFAVFRRLEITSVKPCDVQLSKVKNIPYQCWQYEDSSATLPVWKYSLGFKFGKLSPSQWTTLSQTYSTWGQDAIEPYNADHDYWLIDFMPPLMQATNRHRFHSQVQSHENKMSTVLANCWGTVFELLRLKDNSPQESSYLMMVPPDDILHTFENTSSLTEDIQSGDILLISHRHGDRVYLDHSAIMLDDQIMFEKAGAGDAVPYRIVDLDTMHQIWRPDVFDYQIRRPHPDIALPHPNSFQSQNQPSLEALPQTLIADDDPNNPSQQYYSIFPLPSLESEAGRAILPKEVYNPSYFQSSQP